MVSKPNSHTFTNLNIKKSHNVKKNTKTKKIT